MSDRVIVPISIPKSIYERLDLDKTANGISNSKSSVWEQTVERVMDNLSDDIIRKIFLENGFKTRLQKDFTEDLNPYCYTAGRELIKYVLENMSSLNTEKKEYTHVGE